MAKPLTDLWQSLSLTCGTLTDLWQKHHTDLWQSLSLQIPDDLRRLGLSPPSVADCHGNLPVVAGSRHEVLAVGSHSLAGVEGSLAAVVEGSPAVHLWAVWNTQTYT